MTLLDYSDIATLFGDNEFPWPFDRYQTPPLPTLRFGYPGYVAFIARQGPPSPDGLPEPAQPLAWRVSAAEDGALQLFVTLASVAVTPLIDEAAQRPFEVERQGTFEEVRQGLIEIRELIGATSEAFLTGGDRPSAEADRLRDVLRGTLGQAELGAWAAMAPDYFAWVGID